MKIILVFPPFYLESMYNLPPLGLINLATAIKGSGHTIVLMDLVLAIRQGLLKMGKKIYADCADMILEQNPEMIGFSAQCTTYPPVIQISKLIREKRRDIKIVIGGHNASFADRTTLERFPFVDSIVRGEGELTFKELVSAYGAGKGEEGIPGVTYRRGDEIIRNAEREMISDLDELPFPDHSFLPDLAQYRDACRLSRSIAILEVGRGCPYSCIYCSESIMWRHRTRAFSVTRLVNEMENLAVNFGAECFLLAYDQFTANRSFVESFCQLVIEKELNHFPWYCISRLDSVDASLLALMKKAGCESMCYGIDSGSDKTLHFIRKRVNRHTLYKRVVETADQGIIPTLSFVVGFPEEQKTDIDETLWLALRAGAVGNNNPLIQMPTVLPGTELHTLYKDRLVRKVDTYFSLGLEFDEGRRLKSDEKLINGDPWLFSSFYNLPCSGIPLTDLKLIASYFPIVVQFYPKTFLLLTLDCKESVSDIFLQFLTWLSRRLKREKLSLSGRDCYLYFRQFVPEILDAKRTLARDHLYSILKYENTSLEAGNFSSESEPFFIDINGIKSFKPSKNQNVLIETFDYDVNMIIVDIKAGNFSKEYPYQKTIIAFRQANNFLNVSQLNEFAKEFLELCDGQTSFESICLSLYDTYGRHLDEQEFLRSCTEAAQILGEEGLLE